MNTYLIEPKAPLVFRTGRPFGSTEGGASLDACPPSTLAGALRRTWACQNRPDADPESIADELPKLGCAGPLVVGWNRLERIPHALYPKPSDALQLPQWSGLKLHQVEVVRCLPHEVDPEAEGIDRPNGLMPVLPAGQPMEKPLEGLRLWAFGTMERWLWDEGYVPDAKDMARQFYHNDLPKATRPHVALDDKIKAAKEGALFQSSGLDFAVRRWRNPSLRHAKEGWKDQEFGLLARFQGDLYEDWMKLGGEGRLAAVRRFDDGWPRCPEKLMEMMTQTVGLRLILATPAYFTSGYLPDWVDANNLEGSPPGLPELRLRLKAVACGRWEPLSGWDLAAKRPKALWRLVPAGAVYWFEVRGGWQPDTIEKLWLSSLCSDPQARRDGFGLVLPGVWSGANRE